jgi:hypothetical protein
LDPRDIEKRISIMDEAGVDPQVLSVSPQAPHFAISRMPTAARRAIALVAKRSSRENRRRRDDLHARSASE